MAMMTMMEMTACLLSLDMIKISLIKISLKYYPVLALSHLQHIDVAAELKGMYSSLLWM
jgi:hypothetical protein